MKMIKQKKGMILIIGLASTFIFIVLTLLFIRMENKKDPFPKALGELQLNALETYQESEKALFFLDQSAKYSIQQAIYDLGQKGGYHKGSDCGDYYGYTLWNKGDEESSAKGCYPSPKNQLFSITDEYLNSYLTAYSLFPTNNYEYLLKQNTGSITLYGFATRNFELSIKRRPREGITSIDEVSPESLPTPVQKGIISWPLDSTSNLHSILTSCYGIRQCTNCASKNHKAIDIDGVTGDKIYAVADGIVESTGGNYNQIVIRHDTINYKTYYLHNSKIYINKGDIVRKGQVIAAMGGYGPKGQDQYPDHLHFGVKKIVNNWLDEWVDPLTLYDESYLDTLDYWSKSNCVYRSRANNYAYVDIIEANVHG